MSFYTETKRWFFPLLKESSVTASLRTSFEGIQNLQKREIQV